MTVKGFIRSYGASVRRAEREQQRRSREAAKYYKQQQKEQEITNATEATRQYAEYISVLKSIHKDCSSHIDWMQIQNEPPPQEPIASSEREVKANGALKNYTPGFLSKFFGLEKRKRTMLEQQLWEAKEKDKYENQERLAQFKKDHSDWAKSYLKSAISYNYLVFKSLSPDLWTN